MEKAAEENPEGFIMRFLAMVKANAGQVEEARSIFAISASPLPAPMKTVKFVMSYWPFKNRQIMETIAEGYVKAGLHGNPNDFYKISSENRLTGKEMEDLFFGKRVSGPTCWTKKPWYIVRSQDGTATILDNQQFDTGRSWIEDDMLCNQWDNLHEGLKDCWVIYRNPEGTPDGKDEYLGLPGFGINPFSIVE